MAVAEVVVSSATWNRKQQAFLEARSRYIDFEGALRSGKTTALVRKVLNLCIDYPGIYALLCRYTQDALNAQLKPLFYDMVPDGLLGAWHAEEEYHVVGNGSRVYLRALKSSETAARYAKFQGLTLGAVGVSQAEEMPPDYWQVLKARASQSGTPMQRLLDANPPDEWHWLAKEFPEDRKKMPPDHVLIQASMYDNAMNLDPTYIADMEQQYPLGHPLRRRFIEGRRGVGYVGDPVYGGLFRRALHVAEEAMNPELPLYEAWDFGRAAVLWMQMPPGRRVFLGELMGTPGEYLETFVPKALEVRAHLFPNPLDVLSCCDPAGADRTSHGTMQTAVEVLRQHGVAARWVTGANHPERRTFAIQQLAGYLARLTPEGPGLVIHPRCEVLATAFEAGYVKDEHAAPLAYSPAIIRPKKDGTFDHLMNCAEYLELNFGTAVLTATQRKKQEQRWVQQSQRDHDPYDRTRRQVRVGRGGY